MGVMLAKLEKMASSGSVLGLERMELLLKLLDHPEKRINVVHVAGTNGKGSTCAAISSILQSAGYQVGLYTSPHLIRLNERFKINGEEIPDQELEGLAAQLHEILEVWDRHTNLERPTQFELYTALAFLYFVSKSVDLAVVEVGLGGRLDATNLVNPLISVLTPINYDHTERLGTSVEEIAREKAGIIKKSGRVVLAPQQEQAAAVITGVCQSLQAEVCWVGKDVTYRKKTALSGQNCFDYQGKNINCFDLCFSLLGEHQIINAAVALTVIDFLIDLGYQITSQSVREGLLRTKWPGRIEVMNKNPLVIFDGAHNPHGALALARAIKNNFQYEKLIIVLGVLADKDIKGILRHLMPIADQLIITKPSNERAVEPENVKILADHIFTGSIFLETKINKALETALSQADRKDLICVTGSLYLLGESKLALEKLLQKSGKF